MSNLLDLSILGFGQDRNRLNLDMGGNVAGILRTVTPSSIEEGSSATLLFRLTTKPTAQVRVVVFSSDSGVITPNPSMRDFTTLNWDTPQSVTITGTQDSDTLDETATITLSAFSADSNYQGVTSQFTLTVLDDDEPPTVWFAGSSNDALFTVDIGASPITATRVGSATAFGISETSPRGLAYKDGVIYMIGTSGDYLSTVDQKTGVATRVGSADNFGIPLNTVHGLTARGDDLYVLSDSPDGIYTLNTSTGVASGPISGSFGSEVSPRAMASDGTNVYFVGHTFDRLYNFKPSTGVVTVVGDGASNSRLAHVEGLAFYKGTLYGCRTGVRSMVFINTMTGAATTLSTASGYGVNETSPRGMTSNTPLAVGGASGSSMGFVHGDLPDTIDESSTATFDVKLNAAPSEGSITTVTVKSNHTDVVKVTDGASLTFDGDNYDTMQTVTLTAQAGAGNLGAQIVIEASGGGFDDNVMDFYPSVTPVDDSLIVGGASLLITEGTKANIPVRLSSQPSSTVLVRAKSSDTGAIGFNTFALAFTPSNWDTDQNIVLNAVGDADTADETVTITFLDGVSLETMATRIVRVVDDD